MTNSFKMFFYFFSGKMLGNDFITFIIVCNDSNISCITFVSASAMRNFT